MGTGAETDPLAHIREEVKKRAERGDTLPEITQWVHSNGFDHNERVIAVGLAKAQVRRQRALRIDRYIRSLEASRETDAV